MPPKKRPVSPDESTSGTETAKRKKNISRACTTCRRRRMRCDGNARCSTCVLYEEDCIYEPDLDGRKPATKMFVEALQNRIKVLEEMLGDQESGDGADNDNSSVDQVPPVRPDQSPASQKVSGSLIVDNESLAHHGPTSVFMHLPEPSSSEETGLTPSGQTFASYTDLSELDWARHLPPEADLTYEQHEILLDHFFSYFNGWSWWIDEMPFRSDWAYSVSALDPQTRTQHYSPLLHNAILSVVSLYIDAPEARSQSKAYAVRAASLMEGEAERGMCSTVRGLLFLGSHHWAHNKRSVAWLYEGTGVRLAQTMGLNVDCGHLVDRKLLTAETKRQRDRCFYTVYVQDQLWGLTYGRAAGLTTQDFETAIPAIDPGADQLPWLDHNQRAALRRGEKVQAGPSWLSSTFHYSCILAGIADRLQKGLYRMRSRHQETAQRRLISALHLELNTWLLDLPSPLRLETAREPLPTHVINMHAMCRYLQILLHRPTYTRPFGATSEARDLAVKTCDFAASDIMRLLRRHEAYPGMRYVTTATVNITFTVGTIHLLTAVQPATPPERRTEALSDARECIRYLKAMPWFCATKGGEALEKMLIDWNILPREPSPPIDLGQFGTTKDLGKLDSEISKFLLAAGWKPPQDAPAPPAPRVDQFSLNSASWTGSRGTDAGWDLMSTLAPGPGSYAFGNQAGQPGTVTQPAYGGSAGDYMSGAQGPAVIPFEVTQPTVTQPDLASFFPLDWAPYIPSLVDILGSDSQS